MGGDGRLTVILPTLDEVENIPLVVPALLALDIVAAVVVVDDGSGDGTPDAVGRIAANDARVTLVRRREQRSLARSIQEGIDVATTELVGWMDADGTMPAGDLTLLCAAIDHGADLAVGSRFCEGGALKGQVAPGALGVVASFAAMRGTQDGPLGAAASWALNRLLLPSILGRRGAHDWTSGFAVARRSILAALPLRGSHGEYFFDLWIRAEGAGAVVAEVPCRMLPRAHGRSKTAPTAAALVRRGAPYLLRALQLRATSTRRT
jgi:dolichol-phosphate mannosyltransferase